ncbi:MAG TPA: radical SAM protein [Candidatus Margulisiibacteriota bacterium]|nr:radical SAM protein [Candidatus Margulisiibacteriota bacterium]
MERNKILLIHVGDFPKDNSPRDLAPPLGIVYLGSYLASHGYRVVLKDARLQDTETFFGDLQKELPDAALAGLSVMTPLVKEAIAITKFIKEKDPFMPVVWGGFHPTLFPESTLRNEYIDFIISGEGEKGLLGLTEYLFHKREAPAVPNFMYKVKGEIIKNRIEPGEDLQKIGIPAYELFDLNNYVQQFIGAEEKKLDILTSRGCHARCAFCVNSIINKTKWRSEPLEQTLRNIDNIIERYKVKAFVFIDEDFFCDLQRIKNLIPELARRKIHWSANCRVDYIREGYIDKGMLKALREAGCRELRFGFESGSQRMLNLLNKGITVEQSLSAVEKVSKEHILISASFMMGMPDETPDDVMRTLDLILKIYMLAPESTIIGPWAFRPYPGSILFKRCAEKGMVVPISLNEWSNFYMPDNPKYNSRESYPWFSEVSLLRKVSICTAYLYKKYLPTWLIYAIVKFHILTKCRFIYLDYFVFKCVKKSWCRLPVGSKNPA